MSEIIKRKGKRMFKRAVRENLLLVALRQVAEVGDLAAVRVAEEAVNTYAAMCNTHPTCIKERHDWLPWQFRSISNEDQPGTTVEWYERGCRRCSGWQEAAEHDDMAVLEEDD